MHYEIIIRLQSDRAATKLRGESGTGDRFLSSVGLPRFAGARQATKSDGLSHEKREISAAIEETEQVQSNA
jgi:hypothetical protein